MVDPERTPLVLHVLVVDDEPIIRDVLAEALRFAGYDVTTAQNGADALALMDGLTPDVILLDLMMPRMDGFTFRARQLEDPHLAPIPTILVSADYHAAEALDMLHAAAYVGKPFDLDAVLETVATVCAA